MHKTKLTVEQVLEARLRYAAGERDWTQLAHEYGIAAWTLRSAVLGQTYKYVLMPPKRSG
jgi:hypothetical protein